MYQIMVIDPGAKYGYANVKANRSYGSNMKPC